MGETRIKNFMLGTSFSYLLKILSLIISLVSVPIGLNYFGSIRYGALSIIITIITYLSSSNLGIPSAANVLASKALNKIEKNIIIIKSCLLLVTISIIIGVFYSIIGLNNKMVDFLGNIPSNIYNEVKYSVYITGILFIVNLPFSIFLSGFIANNQVYIVKIYDNLSLNMSFIALLLTIYLKGDLVSYAYIRGMLVILVSILSSLHFLFFYKENKIIFIKSIRNLSVSYENKDLSIKTILITGFRFFLISLAAMVVWNTDNLIISHNVGLESVANYSIIFKLITTAFFLFLSINDVAAPMFGNAYALGEFDWIQNVYSNITNVSAILGGLIWIGSIACSNEIIDLWVGPSIHGGFLVLFSLGGYGFILSVISVHASLLSSLNSIKNLVLIGWVEAIANFVLSFILVKHFGSGGVALGTFLASFITVFWLLPMEVKRTTNGRVKFFYMQFLKQCLVVIPCLLISIIITSFIGPEYLRLFLNFIVIIIYITMSYRFMPKHFYESLMVVFKRFKKVDRRETEVF